jgi:hypothetical protein
VVLLDDAVEGCVATFRVAGWCGERIVEWEPKHAIFKWRQTEPCFILCAVRWYLPQGSIVVTAAWNYKRHRTMSNGKVYKAQSVSLLGRPAEAHLRGWIDEEDGTLRLHLVLLVSRLLPRRVN